MTGPIASATPVTEPPIGKPAVRTARLDDLDRPLYRIFPLWFFEQALTLGSIVLVPPSRWPDPYEDICANVMMRDARNPRGGQKELRDYLMPAYAQCWSFESNSDILLRAYSRVTIHPILRRNVEPALEGVRVETTPRKLIHALHGMSNRPANVQFFLGRVVYAPASDVSQALVNTLAQVGASAMGQNDRRADMLFLKRDYYRHEDEVRLLAIFSEKHEEMDTYPLQIDPNQVFSRVDYDPRLALFERREREARARQLGYTGPFGGEEEATQILWDVELPNGWGD